MPAKDFDEARWNEDSRIEFVPEDRGYYALGIIEAIYIGTNPPRLCDTTIRERVRSHFTNKDQQRISRYLSSLESWENIRIWYFDTPRPCIEERRLVTEYKLIHKGYMPEFNELRVWNPCKCPECCSIPPTPMAPHLTTWQWKRVPQCEASTDGQFNYEMIDPRRIPNKKGIYAIGRVILFRSELTQNLKQSMQEHLAGLPGSIVRIWWRRANPEIERPLQQVISRMTDSRHSLRISTISLNSNRPNQKTSVQKNQPKTKPDHVRPPDDVLTMSRSSSVSSVDRRRQNSMPVRLKGGRVVQTEDSHLRGRQNSMPIRQRGRRAQRAQSESRLKDVHHSEDDLDVKKSRTMSERSLPDKKPSLANDLEVTSQPSRHSSTKTESGESSGFGQPSLSHLAKTELETINVASLLRPSSSDNTDFQSATTVHKRDEFISELKSAQRRILGNSVLDSEQSETDEVFVTTPNVIVDNEMPSTSRGSVSRVPASLPRDKSFDHTSPLNVDDKKTLTSYDPSLHTTAPLVHNKELHQSANVKVRNENLLTSHESQLKDSPPPLPVKGIKPSVAVNVLPIPDRKPLAPERPPKKPDSVKPNMMTTGNATLTVKQTLNDSVESDPHNKTNVAAPANGRVLGRRTLIKVAANDPGKNEKTVSPSRPDTPDSVQSDHRPATPVSKVSDHSSKTSGKGNKPKKSNKKEPDRGKQRSQSLRDPKRPKPIHSDRFDRQSVASDDDHGNRIMVQYKNKKTGRIETVDITDVQYRKRAILERREAEKRALERKEAEKREAIERRKEAIAAAKEREREVQLAKRAELERAKSLKEARAKEQSEAKRQLVERKKSMKKSKDSEKSKPQPLPSNEGYELKATRSDKDCVIS